MQAIDDLMRRVAQLEQLVGNVVRVGTVSSSDPAAGTVRVAFDDQDSIVSDNLPVLVRQSLQNKDYGQPDVGEQVICVFLPTGVERGFVLGSFYSTQEDRPANSQDIRAIQFSDGGRVEYNRDTGKLFVDAKGDIEVVGDGTVDVTTTGAVTVTTPGLVTVDAPDTIFTGTVTVQGLLTFNAGLTGDGAVTNNGVNISSTHTHPINSGSSAPGPTGTPT